MRTNISNIIVKLMDEKSYRNLSFKEISSIFARKKSEQEEIKNIINELVNQGIVIRDKKQKYGLASKNGVFSGTISINAKGYGFISPVEGGDNIFVSPENMNYAMHLDKVTYRITKPSNDASKAEGVIVSVTNRNTDVIVGKIVRSRNFGFVIPNDNRVTYDIYIPKKLLNGAKTGDIVSARILKYPSGSNKPEGMVTEIIGEKKSLRVDIKSELVQKKVSTEFNLKVQKQSIDFPRIISSMDRNYRKDFSDKLIYTIDGEESKDLDDAISVDKLPNGNYELGVYIADVAHYVTENSPIDKEAIQRGTSIYFADTVIPMLPEILSNQLCSLNPNEDKLAIALIMEFNSKGNVVESKIFESVIVSKFRLTYDDVTQFLNNNTGEVMALGEQLQKSLLTALELSEILKSKRNQRGSIDFNFAETKFELSGENVIGVKRREIGIANHIIEEFMIAANECIAETFYHFEIPFLYRVHEAPKSEKIDPVIKMLANFNVSMKHHKNGEMFPKDIQEALSKATLLPQKDMIEYSLLRSMQKAKYSSDSTSHFGLASKYYTHFTSPIRRYPDLQIHRIIKEYVKGQLNSKRIAYYSKILPKVGDLTSSAEIKAIDVERTVDDILKCYYMSNHVGDRYNGKIISITAFGLFVLLENNLEGLIRYSDMIDDYYSHNVETMSAIGEHHKKSFQIGDLVDVKVTDVSFEYREIRLEIIDVRK